MFRPSAQRTLHLPSTVDETRRVLRAHLAPAFADIPRAWFGGGLASGVKGRTLGRYAILAPVPPNRNLWRSRNSPTVIGRIRGRDDGGSDLHIYIYAVGFPYRKVSDPAVTTYLDDWLSKLAQELGAT
jgi:hypothetical protein